MLRLNQRFPSFKPPRRLDPSTQVAAVLAFVISNTTFVSAQDDEMRRTTPAEPSLPIEPAVPLLHAIKRVARPKGSPYTFKPSNPFRSTCIYEQSHTGGCRSGQPHEGSGE